MGRPVKEIDSETLYDLLERGFDKKEVAKELGVSGPTLTKRMALLSESQGLLLKYRQLQDLHLTELQARILEAITPEKIEGASLGELVAAFKVLKDKESTALGKPTEIKGLVAYLLHIEQEEQQQKEIEVSEYFKKEGISEAQITELKENAVSLQTEIANKEYTPAL